MDIHGAIGDFGFSDKTGYVFGLTYSRQINRVLSLETGLLYSNNQIQENSIIAGGSRTYNSEIKMVSVPTLAKFTFFKYFYGDAGLNFDFQTNGDDNTSLRQSGIGIEGGIGVKYNFGPVGLFINPFVQRHAVIGFSGGNDFNLMNAGVKFGVGYNF